MAERMRRTRDVRRDDEGTAEEATAPSGDANELRSELDDILDEIDEALEANAEEFVRSYVQKGGE